MEDAGPPTGAAAAAAAGGDWRSQINPLARKVMVDNIFKNLRWHLPVSDEERLSRLRKFAVGFESRFYKEATSKDSYKRKIAMLLIYVENMNQNSHRQAPELPPQGNNLEESSGVTTLTSLQQTQQPKTSTSLQDSYLPNLGQSLTGAGQAFTLQNMSGQSTIPHMQLMGTLSVIQSGAQQNLLNIGHQPMQSLCLQSPQYLEGQLRHPQLSMNYQPALQQILLTQEPSFPLQQQQQESMGQQPNLHQIQLICQQNSAVDMQQQHGLPVQSIFLNPPHPDNNDVLVPRVSTENFGNFRFAVSPGLAICHTVASGAGDHIDPLASSCSGVQLSTLENNADREHAMPTGHEMGTSIPFSRNEDSTFSDEMHGLLNSGSPPSLLSVLFAGTEIGNEQEDWAAFLSAIDSGTQMENSQDEVPNFGSMADGIANQNKRKFDHISSWEPMLGPSTYSGKYTILGEPAEFPKVDDIDDQGNHA